MVFALLDPTNGSVDTLSQDSLPFVGFRDSTGRTVTMDVPKRVFPSGTVGVSSLFVTSGNAPEICEYDFAGTPLRSIRVRGLARTLERASYDSAVVKSANSAADPVLVRALLDSVTRPTMLGVWSALLADPEDVLWALAVPEPGATLANFHLFDKSRTLTATVAIPANFEIHQVGRDFVLGVLRNDDGLQVVRRYTLYRRRRA